MISWRTISIATSFSLLSFQSDLQEVPNAHPIFRNAPIFVMECVSHTFMYKNIQKMD